MEWYVPFPHTHLCGTSWRACWTSILLFHLNVSHNGIYRMDPIEYHDFYQCIRGLLCVQKLGGGRIQRTKSEHKSKLKYYSLKIYCMLCTVITFGALLRTIFFFSDGFSVKTDDIFAYLIIVFYITAGATQITSFFVYPEILPFWDSLLSAIPQKLSHNIRRPKVVIQCILAVGIFQIIVLIISSYYFIFRQNPDPAYLRLAVPWTDTLAKARISFLVTFSCVLPAVITWTCSGTFFLTGAYYLRAGFIDLHKAMGDDSEMITNLSTYKQQHLRLSEITETLDSILRAYIGASLSMATFDMCFLIFTLGGNDSMLVLMGSIGVLYMAITTLLAIVLLSISINSWVNIMFFILQNH